MENKIWLEKKTDENQFQQKMYFCSEKVARFGCDSNQYCKTSLDNLEIKDAITINAAPRKRPIKWNCHGAKM